MGNSTALHAAFLLFLTCPAAVCQGGYADASLEQLLNVQVTSVSKKDQKLAKAAAAIFVIRQEDIRRSGAADLADALRLAPGVDVARINANSWAISIRGFNSRYSNKVLVLVDGRSVYTPSFSGVFWEHIDMPLEDIERIEVIRGPGATVWGANAVNGVINIITKSAKATKGGLLSSGSGSEVWEDGLLRYGAPAGRTGAWRVFGRYFNTATSPQPDGSDSADGWNRVHGGFRSDWDLSPRDALTVQGDLFSNRMSETLRTSFIPTPLDRIFTQRLDATGGNLLARWSHTSRAGSETVLQTYYDAYRRTDFAIPETMRAFDIEFQHHLAAGSRHDIVWGLGYRRTASGITAGYPITFSPPFRKDNLFSAFVQDEIQVTGTLWWTLGCKLEHNAYTGFEYEPSTRLAWTPSSHSTLWAAASRAIRQPARIDQAVGMDLASFPLDANTVETLRLMGNPRLQAEEVRDYELGFRRELTKSASIDVAAFLSAYRRLSTIEPGAPEIFAGALPVQVTIPMLYDNRAAALNHGGEVSLNWSATPRWRISSTYSLLHVNARLDSSSRDTTTMGTLRSAPEHMFQVRSQCEVTHKVEFDQWLSWTAKLPGTGIPGYARLDARLARRIGESIEISVTGQNLLRPGTREFPDVVRVIGTLDERRVYGKITWMF